MGYGRPRPFLAHPDSDETVAAGISRILQQYNESLGPKGAELNFDPKVKKYVEKIFGENPVEEPAPETPPEEKSLNSEA